MQIGEFTFPDKCPDDCIFIEDFKNHGQNSVCARCPVFNCQEFEYEGTMTSMLEPNDYRSDWAAEFYAFVVTKDKIEGLPELPLVKLSDDNAE